jgi:putative GTP pyrophosphokinase
MIINFSKGELDRAGDSLVKFPFDPNSLDILNKWRSAHNYPLNTFQATLRKKLKYIDETAITAQRLKRTHSIIHKLQRFESMKLSRMQDIGGLRAIVNSKTKLEKLYKAYLGTKLTHILIRENNYILNPKNSGYRGIHLVYKYKNKLNPNYDGLLIELQIRTRLQHSWATAVETIGTFIGEPLKSSMGNSEWLEFFALVSSAFAIIEKSPKLIDHNNLTNKQLILKIKNISDKLKVFETLDMYKEFIKHTEKLGKGKTFYLLVLDIQRQSIQYTAYPKDKLNEAIIEYSKIESKFNSEKLGQAVLVSADSVLSLKKAYPNYFLDTRVFSERVKKIITNGL